MKSILLIGVGNFGAMIARQLHEAGHHVLAVDRDEERINAVLPIVTDAEIGDSTNESFLRSSLETTSLLKELGGKLVVSRADREIQSKFLLRNGADEVINPEKQIAKWAAIRYGSNHILDFISLDDDHAIYEVAVPEEWCGYSIGQLDIRKRYGINLLGIKQDGKTCLSITPETVLKEGMTIFVLAGRKAMHKCFRI